MANIIRFRGRSAYPAFLRIGNERDNLAEQIQFVLPSHLDGATAFLFLRIGDFSDVVDLGAKCIYKPTRTHTQYPGRWEAYLQAQMDGDVVWHSDVFTLYVGALPDSGEMIEQAYPTAIEEALKAVDTLTGVNARAETLEPGSEATVTFEEDENGNRTIVYGIPRGKDGGGEGGGKLPVASPDTLGGVMPVAKTEDMTQPVGVDSDGRLWVAPIGGGGDAEPTTHGVVWNLVNVTSSNNAVSVADGASLVAVLTPAEGYRLGDVIVTMGGEALTGVWDADTTTITIPSVIGDVIISCVGEAESTEVVDTSPVIAQAGYCYRSVSTTVPNVQLQANAAYCVTKIYEFIPNVAEIEAHPNYNAELGYVDAGLVMHSYVHYIPNSNFILNDGTDTNSTYKKAAAFVDGILEPSVIAGNLTSQSAEGISEVAGRNDLQKSINGIAFTLYQADIDDSYAYWTSVNGERILPVGVSDGDIIFAGKNTIYYGMTNIHEAAEILSYDDDVAQNYAVATASILGEETDADPNKAYGISPELAAVIDEVRTAWMIENGGDPRKIPLIITTDQHGRRNAGIFNMIGKTLSMHDVSKICNLGDTCSVEWIDSSDVPLLSCATLENWCESIKQIPFSKRLDVYGNHDSWYYDGYSVAGNAIGTRYPSTMHHLDQYFRNIYARRNNNHGWGVIRDDYFNVKYLIITGFEYVDGAGGWNIRTKQMEFIISELEKNDGYDIIVVSHVPLHYNTNEMTFPTGYEPTGTENYRVSNVDTDELFAARKNKVSGTVTDSDGVEHSYDFRDCTTDILCALHGHTHHDAYNYVGTDGLLSAALDWFDDNTVHFVLIDRINRYVNIWKLEGDALTYQNYQIPLDKPAE